MPTLHASIHLYLQVDRSSFTNYSYASILRRLALYLNGEREIKDITYAELLAYVGDLKSGIKPTTLARYAATIRYFLCRHLTGCRAACTSTAEGPHTITRHPCR
jgi:hypothetical protein